jgi:ABC-2 type transport system permease protein
LTTTDAHLATSRWPALAAALLLGSLPFALLGIALGYWASPRGALPVANILYLLLAFAGGLWTTPAQLPAAVERVSPLVPTRPFGNVLWDAAAGRPWRLQDWALLLVWSAAFGLLANWGFRRDEGRRYG